MQKNFTHNLVIAVGLNQYQNNIAKLNTTKPDPEELAKLLKDEYQVELITDDTERKPRLNELENLLTLCIKLRLQVLLNFYPKFRKFQ